MAEAETSLSPKEAAVWTRGHVVPFALWIAGLALVVCADTFWPASPVVFAPIVYAVKSLLCAALLFWWKPWRYYDACTLRSIGWGLLVGLFVAIIWIAPETVGLHSGIRDIYHRWLIVMPGVYPSYYDPAIFPALPSMHPSLAYSPGVCGWTLTICKLLGSAFVIAAAEEYFFRGFLYRWLQGPRPWTRPLNYFDPRAFMLTVLIFGFEHDRWLAGLIAGVAYGWLANKRGDMKAAVTAHMTTNFLLGLYVIIFNRYGFW